VYVGNDPTNQSDPDGQFVLKSSSLASANNLKAQINSMASSHYEFDTNFVFSNAGQRTEGSGSTTYSKIIDDLIAAPNAVSVDTATAYIDNGTTIDVDKDYNGGVTLSSPAPGGPINVIVSPTAGKSLLTKGGGTTIQTAAQKTMHELSTHAEPAIHGRLGSSLKMENRIRKELKLPQVKPDENHTK
jgi:hypothetical protein